MSATATSDPGRLLYPPNNKDPNKRRRRWPWIALAVVAVVAIGGVIVHQISTPTLTAQGAKTAPVTNASASRVPQSSAPRSTPTPTPTRAPEDVSAVTFAQLLNADDAAAAVLMTEPGSSAHLYAEGVQLLADGRYASLSSEKRAAPKLSAFVLAPDGLIMSLSRNGIPLDKLIAPGDGQVYTAEPGAYDSWTGTVDANVHSFRLFDGELQIVMTNTNHASAKGGLSFTEYTANGKGYSGACCGDALPGTTETSEHGFDGAPGGGTAYGMFFVGGISSQKVELAVPALG